MWHCAVWLMTKAGALLTTCFLFGLKMEAIGSFETSLDFHRSVWRYIPEASILHSHGCENLKFSKNKNCLLTILVSKLPLYKNLMALTKYQITAFTKYARNSISQ
jgi:hypothetical protein